MIRRSKGKAPGGGRHEVAKLTTLDVWRILTYRSGAPGFVSEFKPIERDVAYHIFCSGPDWDTFLIHEDGWREYTSTKALADIQIANALGVCKRSVSRALQRLDKSHGRPFYVEVVSYSGIGKIYRCFIQPKELSKFENLSQDVTSGLEEETKCPVAGQSDSHTNLSISTNPPQLGNGGGEKSLGLREEIQTWAEHHNDRWKANGSTKILNWPRISICAKNLPLDDWKDIQEAFEMSYRDGVNNPNNVIKDPTAYVLRLISECS